MNNMEVKALIKDSFVPMLRNHGFKGSGLTFRKITNNHFIYVITIQFNRYGGSFCIEMGVYIDVIPDVIGELVQPSKVKPYVCEFRKRLTPDGLEDYWWSYNGNTQEVQKSIEHLITTFQEKGLAFFGQFIHFPDAISRITIDEIEMNAPILRDLGAPCKARLYLTLARMNLYLNNYNEAVAFCNRGLNCIGDGTALIPVFEEIKRRAVNCIMDRMKHLF